MDMDESCDSSGTAQCYDILWNTAFLIWLLTWLPALAEHGHPMHAPPGQFGIQLSMGVNIRNDVLYADLLLLLSHDWRDGVSEAEA